MNKKERKSRGWTWILPGLIYASVAVIGAWQLLGVFVPWTPYSGRESLPFSREAWLASKDDPEGSRYLMLRDLLRCYRIVGMTREEVEELLGPLSGPIGDDQKWRYYLGPEPSEVSVDSIWLNLTIEDGVATAIGTATD